MPPKYTHSGDRHAELLPGQRRFLSFLQCLPKRNKLQGLGHAGLVQWNLYEADGRPDRSAARIAAEKGSLYPYVETEGSYRCPVAKKTEMRTYSMFESINLGRTDIGPIVTKLNEIRNSGSRGLFVDDYMDNWDADWTMHYDQPRWWNPVPMRHGKGTVVSCADGHAEWWDREDSRTLEIAKLSWADAESKRGTALFNQPNNPDLIKSQMITWGRLGYK